MVEAYSLDVEPKEDINLLFLTKVSTANNACTSEVLLT